MQVFLHHKAKKYFDRLNWVDKEPASPKECAKVERRVREYHKNPQTFVPLKSI